MKQRSSTKGSSLKRCPACGQRWESQTSDTCSLCGYSIGTKTNTGDDVTPYAVAFSQGLPAWKQMSEWIWYSGSGRLKHLALMRASSASRHYARINAYLLAVGMAIVQLTRVGWQRVGNAAASPGQSSADGWFRLVSAPGVAAGGQVEDGFTALWWNPVQALIAAVTAAVASLVLSWLGYCFMRWGITMALKPAYRGEDRMTAALHYGSAWTIPAILASLIAGLQPIAYFGSMAQWSWTPPQRVFLIGAAVFMGVSMVMGWFWLVRLGATAPSRTKTRVFTFFLLVAPLIVLMLVAAWWKGLDALYSVLFDTMKLNFS